MKHLLCWLLFLTSSGHAGELSGTGEWSAPVKGLRGRLCFAEGKLFDGTRIARTYIELENCLGSGSLLIDFRAPTVQISDAAGKLIPAVNQGFISEVVERPSTLVLPLDAVIRLRISVDDWPTWVIPNEKSEERFLAGAFSIPELLPGDAEGRKKDHERRSVWRGTLNLPKLKLPTDPGESTSK